MPASHDRPGALPSSEFEFTPRQREVLDLLAAGRTNAQVADALGVSLDGAKWHVREILSILGVEGREDAAEYWRRHNGVPSRFRRTWRSFTSAGLALRLAAAAGGVVVVAGIVLAVLFVLGGSKDPEQAEPTQPSPTPVPATATAVATPSATVSGTPATTAIALTVGSQGIMGYDTTVYYTAGCVGCGRAKVPLLYRLRRTPDGSLERRDLFPFRADYPQGYVNGFAAEWDRGHFIAAVCVEKYCGGEGEPTTDKPLDLWETHDGGVTWSKVGTLPLGHFLVGFVADRTKVDGAIDGKLLVAEFAEGTRFYYWPSGDAVEPPDPRITFPVVIEGAGLLWRGRETPDGPEIFFGADGNEFLRVEGSGAKLIGTLKDGGWVAKWDGSDGEYVGHFNGGLDWSMRIASGYFEVEGIIPPHVESSGSAPTIPSQLYGNVLLDDFYCFGVSTTNCNNTGRTYPLYPSLIEIDPAQIHPIAQIVDEYPEFTGNYNPFVLNIDINPRVRVLADAGPGDCLNVRAGPSATASVIACVPGGVLLLKRSDAPVTADGVTWVPVWTPSVERGWASAEFLR